MILAATHYTIARSMTRSMVHPMAKIYTVLARTLHRSALVLSICVGLVACETDRERFSLEEYQGRWLFINYWAEWCKPCAEEIPELNQLADQFSGTVAVLGVNFDQVQGELLQQQASKLGIQFELAKTDPAPVLAVKRPTVLPTTLVFSPQGQLHRTLIGPQTVDMLAAAAGLQADGALSPQPEGELDP